MAVQRQINGWKKYLSLLLIFSLALVLRLSTMPLNGNTGDMQSFDLWIQTIQKGGLFNFYNPSFHLEEWDRTYPPLATYIFATLALIPNAQLANFNPTMNHLVVALIKLFPVLCELAIVVIAILWLRERKPWDHVVPVLLAISPGLILATAWWGQYDAAYTVFLILALVALNKDRVNLAWIMLAVACLIKQPAIVMAPLIFVLSLRRYGWRKTGIGLALAGVLCVLAFGPFVMAQGLKPAVTPYLQLMDFPTSANLADNGFNFWHLLASFQKGSAFRFGDVGYSDARAFLGPITYSDAGKAAMAVFTLFILTVAWKHADERKEFVWGAALYVGFFVLPTEVHERYLYGGAVMIIFAVAQDPRLLWVALGVMVTFAYNVAQVMFSYIRPDLNLWVDQLSILCAILNCLYWMALIWYILRPAQSEASLGYIDNAIANSMSLSSRTDSQSEVPLLDRLPKR